MQRPSPWGVEEDGKEPVRSWAGTWPGVHLHHPPALAHLSVPLLFWRTCAYSLADGRDLLENLLKLTVLWVISREARKGTALTGFRSEVSDLHLK